MARKYLRSRHTLEAIEESRIQLARLQREVKQLENRCTAVTQSYDPKLGGLGDVHSALWDKLADKRELLTLQTKALEQWEQDVEQWIDLLPNARWRMLLRCHYLDGIN